MKEKIYVKSGRKYKEIQTPFPEEGIWMVLNRDEGQTRVFKISEIPENSFVNFKFISFSGELAKFVYLWCTENSGYTVIELATAICNFFAEKQKKILFETKNLVQNETQEKQPKNG